MASAFTSLVDLCRLADAKRIAGTDLVLAVKRTSANVALLASVQAGGWDHTLVVDGQERTEAFDRLADGSMAEIVLHGMARSNHVIANNVGMLLRFNQGAFLGRHPEEFYLLDEDYASWEAPLHIEVLAYYRALRIATIIVELADVVRDRAGTAGEAVILASRKLSIPIVYDSHALRHVAEESVIDSFQEAAFIEPHREARQDIAKRVLIRFFDSVPELDRFGQVLRRLNEVNQTFVADFDIYASGFNFDKVRDDFERKKLDFIVKTNTASSDVMNKLIAIPVGQGLLAGQMKPGLWAANINRSLLLGCIVFAVIAIMLIANQTNTLFNIREELRNEKRILKERAAPTYERLKGMIGALDRRLLFHLWVVPIGLILLLLTTTIMTFVAFFQTAALG